MTDPRTAEATTSVRFWIDVETSVDQAFRVFTSEFDSWWPRDHRIGQVPMSMAVLEQRPGGRWYEIGIDGSECEWGMVLAWDPPTHLALSWHLDGEFRFHPGLDESSRVDVFFEDRGDGTTRVVLEHTGLERHGASWTRLREAITRGWPRDLQRFRERLEREPASAPPSTPPTKADQLS